MAKGWTLERRAKQAEAIQRWKPWERSTGPKTDTGKATTRENATKHGGRGSEAKALKQAVANLLVECMLPVPPGR